MINNGKVFLVSLVFSHLLLIADTNTTLHSKRTFNTYDEGIQQVSKNIALKDFQNALTLLNEMDKYYPNNTEIYSTRASLYYWTQSYQASIAEYEKLYALTHDPLYLEQRQKVSDALKEVQCQQKKNFLSLQRETYSYGDKQNIERDTTLQVGIKNNGITWIGSGASIDRYGLIDRQIGIEAYSNLGNKQERRWGYLAYYQSQNPSFLPKWDASAGVYQGVFDESEISLVYRHMSFATKGVDIVKPGISFPLPWTSLRMGEEFYLVPDTHSYASVSTFSYDPSLCLHGYYTFTVGNSAETFRDETDIRRVKTRSHALGGTWRFDPSWAIGAEVTDGFRSGLYRRSGGRIFLKYFW